jgi:hypothetical protein
MAEERCEKCDLPVGAGCGCGVVQRIAAERRAEIARVLQEPGVIEARHPGTCVTCSTRYPQGEPIKHTEDGWSGALCCPEVPRA